METALVLPVLLVLLVLAAEIGRAYFMAVQMTNGAREGAIWAAHNQPKETTLAQLDLDTRAVIAAEERSSLAFLVCPSQAVTITRTNSTITNPPASGQTADEVISVTCAYSPLARIPPVPSTLRIATTVRTFLVTP